LKFGSIFRVADGMYISKEDTGNIRNILDNWPEPEVDIIVVTDGSRILGEFCDIFPHNTRFRRFGNKWNGNSSGKAIALCGSRWFSPF
jgi:hypothetical protein